MTEPIIVCPNCNTEIKLAVHLARVVGAWPTLEQWKECARLNRKLRSMRQDWGKLFEASGFRRNSAGLW